MGDQVFQAEVVRCDASDSGVALRLWMYDDRDEFRAAGVLEIERDLLEAWLSEVTYARAIEGQPTLDFG